MRGAIYAEPAAFQTGDASLELTGLFMYRDEPAGEASARAFLSDFDQGTADFENCTGSYRFRAVYPDGRELRFCDNAGVMRWYIRENICPFTKDNCPPPRDILSVLPWRRPSRRTGCRITPQLRSFYISAVSTGPEPFSAGSAEAPRRNIT